MIKARICSLINWIRTNIFNSEVSKVVLCKQFPENIEGNCIYITHEDNELCYLVMKCPCGCGTDMDLSLHKGLKPRWSVEFNMNGTISITPSIWRRYGCESHFFYKKGTVIWCNENN